MNSDKTLQRSSEFNSQPTPQGVEAHGGESLTNFSHLPPHTPVNYPMPPAPPPNQYIPPNPFFLPPPFYSAPPPFFHGNQNPTFNHVPFVNFPPPGCNPFHQSFISSNATLTKHELSTTEELLFPNAIKKPKITANVKLWQISRYFRRFYSLLNELERDLKSYEENIGTNADEDRQSYQSLISKQEKLICLKNSTTMDSTFLCCLKFKISRRKKKRIYRKRMRKSPPCIHVYEIANMHVQQLQQEASRVKQEDNLKQEADNILSSVIPKKTEARYQIQLLTNLLKLHSARVHKLSVETKLTVDSSITGFEKILEKLKNLWESNLRDYITEENGLKLMIKELAVNAEDEDCMQLKRNFEKWLELMFGNSDPQAYQFYSSYDQLIEIRQGWDRYVVDKEDARGTKIPAGWVLPKYNDNETWKKFLFQ